jgi:hypothetical protein
MSDTNKQPPAPPPQTEMVSLPVGLVNAVFGPQGVLRVGCTHLAGELLANEGIREANRPLRELQERLEFDKKLADGIKNGVEKARSEAAFDDADVKLAAE